MKTNHQVDFCFPLEHIKGSLFKVLGFDNLGNAYTAQAYCDTEIETINGQIIYTPVIQYVSKKTITLDSKYKLGFSDIKLMTA